VTSDLGACGTCRSLLFGHKVLDCPCWDRICRCEKALCTQESPPTCPGCQSHNRLGRLFCPVGVRAGHSSCPSPPSLPRREDRPSGTRPASLHTDQRQSKDWGSSGLRLLVHPSRRPRPWPSPGNKMCVLMPPALRVPRARHTSVEAAVCQSQSRLIEQQMLVAQTAPTIFDG